ncbi:DUF4411 family protein [Psychrobacter aestuarii]|uniref:DUF4411 family protein n=1 Tax=Psychrobacter aestuarii TaxID=556327 RepID=A0ABN0W0Z6_9GAMM|nr:DUF4411 family protein [Psychrobacter aestuarii]
MRKICLDTNAIIDICYRYYPSSVFRTIWDYLLNSISAGIIKFIVSEEIYQEVNAKVNFFVNYDIKVLENFFTSFNIDVIPKVNYDYQLIELQKQMVDDLPYFQNMKVDKRFKQIENIRNDLSNVAVAIANKACVLTSEQGLRKDISKDVVAVIKIPDTCSYKEVDCYSWLELFDYLGIPEI